MTFVGVAVVAVVLGLVHVLLHQRLVRATEMPQPWSRVVDAVLVAGWLAAMVGASVGRLLPTGGFRPVGFVGLSWLVVVFYLLLGLLVVGVVLLAIRVIGGVRHWSTDRLRLLVTRVMSGILAVAAVGTTIYGISEARSPQITTETVALSGLPTGFDGLRVAVVSDLHVGPARGHDFTAQVVDLVNGQRPDIVMILGDLADGRIDRVGKDLLPLANLHAPLGIYGVAGNHEEISDDVGAWMRFWRTLGITPLANERTEIRHGGSTIDLAGVYDYSAQPPYAPDLGAALRNRDAQRFVLLLAHQPNQVQESSEVGVDLQLSGHTHGGQIWPLRPIAALAAIPAVTGLDRIGPTTILTTYGAGAWGPPVRVGAPPEVVMVTLQSA